MYNKTTCVAPFLLYGCVSILSVTCAEDTTTRSKMRIFFWSHLVTTEAEI
jgi:hypothetical protein